MMRLLLQTILIFLTIMLFVLGVQFAAHAITPFGANMLTGTPGTAAGGGGSAVCVTGVLNFTQPCNYILWGSLL